VEKKKDSKKMLAAENGLTDWLREEMLAFRNAPSCLQECHYGIAQQSKYLKNQDRLYPHAPHVNTARIDCGTCHSRDIHKVNLPRGYDCIGCHHEKAKEKQCGDCHKIIFDLAKGGLGDYAVVSSQTLECRSCHIGQTGEIVMLNRNACRQCHLDDKTYLSKLEQEREELARLRAQTHEAVQAKWQSLDFQGLQMVERVRTVERANGIHNYHLAKRIYSKAAEYLAGLAVPTSTTVRTASSNSQPRAKGR
jgi:sulfur relay (sulfurtransferase) DsrC/TusE family protein